MKKSMVLALAAVMAAFFYSFQLYCDFSGYSDIAVGMGELLGLPQSLQKPPKPRKRLTQGIPRGRRKHPQRKARQRMQGQKTARHKKARTGLYRKFWQMGCLQ